MYGLKHGGVYNELRWRLDGETTTRHRSKPLTDPAYDLTLHAQLVLITPRDPADLAILVGGDIRRVLDLVPHVPARECQNEDHGGRPPQDPGLEEREDVGPQTVDDRRGDDEAYAGDYQGDGVEGDVQSEGDKVVLDEVVQLGGGETATTHPSVISIGQRAQGAGRGARGTGHSSQAGRGIPGSLNHKIKWEKVVV